MKTTDGRLDRFSRGEPYPTFVFSPGTVITFSGRRPKPMRLVIDQRFPVGEANAPGGFDTQVLPDAIYCREVGTGKPVRLDIPWLEEAAEVTVEAWNNLRQSERLTQCGGF